MHEFYTYTVTTNQTVGRISYTQDFNMQCATPWASLWSSCHCLQPSTALTYDLHMLAQGSFNSHRVDVYCSCLRSVSCWMVPHIMCVLTDCWIHQSGGLGTEPSQHAQQKSCTSINPLIGAPAIVRRRGKEQGFAHCSKLWIWVANVNAWLGSSL